jgi:hypothetical protein
MMQLVVWIVVATVNPAGARADSDHGFHGERFVAAYTTEAECQKKARSVNDDQERALGKTPQLIDELYRCTQVVVQTECHNYAGARC